MNNISNLFNLVEDLRKQKGNVCLICQFPIKEKKNELKLSCGHFYHNSCLKSKNYVLICPYCNKATIKNGNKVTTNNDICKAILKTGKRKGQICNRLKCGYHKLY